MNITLSKRWRFLILFFSLLLLTGVISIKLQRPTLGIDDAYIFMTYGKNFASGNGLVYSPGGERVEGFSSILWMLINALGFVLTNQPQLGLLILNLIIVSFAITQLWFFIDQSSKISWQGSLLIVWILSSPGYIFWMGLPLMDTALWSTCLMLATVSVLSTTKQKWSSWLVILLVISRPEGMLWALIFIGIRFVFDAMRTSLSQGFASIKKPLIVYICSVGLLIGIRLRYFGYPLPNTFYAKVSPDHIYNLVQGGIYLRSFLIDNPIVLFLSLAPAFAVILLNIPWILSRLRKPSSLDIDVRREQLIGISVIVLMALLVPVINGGDHFILSRFFQVAWPLLIIPFLWFADTLSLPDSKHIKVMLVFVPICIFLLAPRISWFWNFPIERVQREFDLAIRGQTTAQELNDMFIGSPPSAGIIATGGFGMAYNGLVIDVLGLNNTEMAHAPGNRYGIRNHASFNSEVFLRQLPVLFLPELPSDDDIKSSCHEIFGETLVHPNSLLHGLLEEKIFWENYDRVLLSNDNRRLFTYIRRDQIETVTSQGLNVTTLSCLQP